MSTKNGGCMIGRHIEKSRVVREERERDKNHIHMPHHHMENGPSHFHTLAFFI